MEAFVLFDKRGINNFHLMLYKQVQCNRYREDETNSKKFEPSNVDKDPEVANSVPCTICGILFPDYCLEIHQVFFLINKLSRITNNGFTNFRNRLHANMHLHRQRKSRKPMN